MNDYKETDPKKVSPKPWTVKVHGKDSRFYDARGQLIIWVKDYDSGLDVQFSRPRDVYHCIALAVEEGIRPKIVCLCGSTKFHEQFDISNYHETMAGNIVLSIGCVTKSDNDLWGKLAPHDQERIKVRLDELHFRKIAMADEVLILNVDGYIGESTWKELQFAIAQDKVIRFHQPRQQACEWGTRREL